MKKFIFMMVAMLTFTVSATAQQKNFAGSSNFFDNWSIGANGGVQLNLNDWNAPQGAVFGLELNKQITPLFGLTFEGNAGVNNRRNWYSNASHIHCTKVIDQVNALVDGRFNLMNAIGGYKGSPRLFEVDVLAGVGYGRGYANRSDGFYNSNALLAKTGANFNFNLGKAKAWTISVRPAVIWNIATTGEFNSNYAVGQLTAAVVYHFKNSNHKHYASLPEPVIVEKKINNTIEKKVVVEKTVFRHAPNINNCWTVNFAQGSSEITSDVSIIAKEINKTKGVYKISGFASPEGTEEINKTLGIARANALKNALIKAGVDENRIEIDNSYESLRTANIILK